MKVIEVIYRNTGKIIASVVEEDDGTLYGIAEDDVKIFAIFGDGYELNTEGKKT